MIAALWTEVCGVGPALSAIDQGYEVYFVTDASGGVSDDAHNMAVQRMVQAGARPITWLQYLLELQRDWARTETYDVVTGIAKEHGSWLWPRYHLREGRSVSVGNSAGILVAPAVRDGLATCLEGNRYEFC